ncbi:hypothetical protein GN157_00060 [Flavobacterium rakeshii]|uniref:Uncharacterized protein n=1 Tax=Flavobacterium rakeshii TaxID=1038845 RepID=A0A6N8H8C2_9FLAO|nr:hypothetical protein [Flavobacterium rakeshii]MUV02090.1 hypothetical protein [Flavobacterium rakeshii]
MKKYLTLLLLLVSVCFYGQEEEKEIVIEGFYKVSLGGGGHALFPVVNNTVKGPINLEIEHYKIPHGFVNTARVRVKGKISRAKYGYDCYYVKNRIVVDEVTLIDTTMLMEKFLKKHADEKKEVLNEGEERIEYFESEGFYNERYEELYYVELKDGEIADTLGICFEGRASSKHSEVYPDKYNADGVYIKGTGFKITGRSYGFPDLYDTQFNICELKVIDTNYTFYNYQQERKDKEKQGIVEIEGFYKINGRENLFFPLKDSLVQVPIIVNLKNNKLPDSFVNTSFVRLKGKLIEQRSFFESYFTKYTIEVDGIVEVDTNILLEDYLKKYQVYKTELKEDEERVAYFEKEGYYAGPFEGHTFVWIKDKEYEGEGWAFFDEDVKQSVVVEGKMGLGIKSSFNKGIYMKVKGIRTYGKRYGHFGGWKSQINISKVEEFDINKSLWEFIELKIRKNGFYKGRRQKLIFPKILEEGKKYTFKAVAVCNCMLEVKRTGGYIDYTFTEKDGADIKNSFSGRLVANPWTYDKEPNNNTWDNYQVTYESIETESRVYDNSKFTVQVYREKDENGNIRIAIEDYINNREFGLTQVKN